MKENAPGSSQHLPTLQIVSFIAAGCRFATEASSVRSQRQATDTDTAKSVEELLGLPDVGITGSEARRILIIRQPTGDLPIRVSEPVTLCELRLNDLHQLPGMLAARSTLNGIRALSTGNDGVTVLIDFSLFNPNVV